MKSAQKHLKIAPNASGHAPLEHWSLLRCELYWAYDRVVAPQAREWSYLPHPAAAWLIRKGEVTLRFADHTETYTAGQWLFPRQAPALQHFSPGCHLLSLRFVAGWPDGKPLFPRQESLAFPSAELPALTEAAEALIGHVRGRFGQQGHRSDLQGTLCDYLLLQPVFYRWLAVWYETLVANGVQPNTLHRLHEKIAAALSYIHSYPLERPLREEAVARHVGLSVSQLNKIFARETGATPSHFWNERRLSVARSRLLVSQDSVKSIAYDLGYSTPANFSHWFKTHSGVSPREYRAQNAEAPQV